MATVINVGRKPQEQQSQQLPSKLLQNLDYMILLFKERSNKTYFAIIQFMALPEYLHICIQIRTVHISK